MVYLGVNGELPVFQAFNQVELPHGPFPVHQVAVFGGDKRQQLPDPAWRGQSLKAEMMLQVQLFVFYPDRLTEPTAQAPVEGRCDDGFLPQLVRKLGDIVIRSILGE